MEFEFSNHDPTIEEEAVVVEEDLILEGSEAVVAEDLILEILLRLPPVSVVRFKSVSKSWYSLITNPCFLNDHARLLRSQRLHDLLVLVSNVRPLSCQSDLNQHRMVVHYYRDSNKLYAIPTQDQEDEPEKPPPFLKVFLDHSLAAFQQKFPRCYLVDSCNGLLLYHARNLDNSYQYKVFNPINNQYAEVPIMALLRDIENPVLFDNPHIVFDPSISLSYKVLTVVPRPHSGYQLYVYSSDTGSWRLLTRFIAKFGMGEKAFMFNGVFYWLVDNDFSICYDVVKESVCLLTLPPRPSDNYRVVFYFGECGGRIRLINEFFIYARYSSLQLPFSFDIMEKDLCSTVWTLKFRVNIEGGYEHLIRRRSHPFYVDVRVIHLYQTERGEEVVLLRLLTASQKMIVFFNITTNTFGKEIPIRSFKEVEGLNAFPFTPTLFPLLT